MREVGMGPAKAAALAAAFKDGQPTKAAEGFARSCGVAVDELIHLETDKGTWLGYREQQQGEATTALLPAIADKAAAFVRQIDKLPLPVKDAPGFASSRLGIALGMEAIRMVEQGVASAEDIDKAMELGYRHPMGPLRLTDLVGLDVRLGIAEYLHETLSSDAFAPPALLRQMVEEGKLGKKSGQGFYTW